LGLERLIGLIEQPRLLWRGLFAGGAKLAMTEESNQLFELLDVGILMINCFAKLLVFFS
jgi:hypothetical protein